MQVGVKDYYLGIYDEKVDAARAYDRVAEILGRPCNFPDEIGVGIEGPRSEGADQAVVKAVEAAKQVAERAKQAAERAKQVAEVRSERNTVGAKVVRARIAQFPKSNVVNDSFEQARSGTEPSEHKGIRKHPSSGKWTSRIKVSPSSRECMNRDICLI